MVNLKYGIVEKGEVPGTKTNTKTPRNNGRALGKTFSEKVFCTKFAENRFSLADLGPVSRKPRKPVGPVKPFLVHLYLKKVYTPETSFVKRTSVSINET